MEDSDLEKQVRRFADAWQKLLSQQREIMAMARQSPATRERLRQEYVCLSDADFAKMLDVDVSDGDLLRLASAPFCGDLN